MNYAFLIGYCLIVNLSAFALFGIDKRKAKHRQWRISENTLLLFAAVGGSIGTLCAMSFFHHKTKHRKFTIGVPMILILQIAAVVGCFCFL